MLLSVVVPAYKQEKTILEDIQNILLTLEQTRFDFELIVVVDGLVDGTASELRKIRNPKLFVYSYASNHGKGYAIRFGMKKTKGDIIAFLDSGMDIDPNGISMIIEHMIWYKADCIVGSKRHRASVVRYPLVRRLYSVGYHILVKLLFHLPVKDTQVGLKVFSRKLLKDVLPRLLVKKHAFDIELLAVAWRMGYHRMYEAPVNLRHNFSSSVNTSTIFQMLIDTLAVFYRMYILRYYDSSSNAWVYDRELGMRINIG